MGKSDKIKTIGMNLDGKDIDLEMYSDSEFKAIRCEITSADILDPMDVAFVLATMAKSLCDDAGMPAHMVFSDLFTPEREGSGDLPH